MEYLQELVDKAGINMLADVLMGAVCADGHVADEELRVVRNVLMAATGKAELDSALEQRLQHFDPNSLNLQVVADKLRDTTPQQRGALFGMLSSVIDADDVFDLDESEYVSRVAKALGARPEEYRDVIFEVVDELPKRSVPPPFPKKG